jgi:hypothetical protein
MPRHPQPTDDQVLDWWERFDSGVPIRRIAAETSGYGEGSIRKALEDLGVLESEILRRARKGRLTGQERAIRDALARIVVSGDDTKPDKTSVRFARSMEHVKPMQRKVIQSARQRRLDAMGAGLWARVIRKDLRAAGLIP